MTSKVLATACKFAFCTALGVGCLQVGNVAFAQNVQGENNAAAQSSTAAVVQQQASEAASNVAALGTSAQAASANATVAQPSSQGSASGSATSGASEASPAAQTAQQPASQNASAQSEVDAAAKNEAASTLTEAEQSSKANGASKESSDDTDTSKSATSSSEKDENKTTSSAAEKEQATNKEVEQNDASAKTTQARPDATYVGFYTDMDGVRRWYENGIIAADKAFYDPSTDAWYWADADGSIATNKDVFIPVSNEDRSSGKWVRFDEQSRMVKGEDYRYDAWYYFDETTGEMAKGFTPLYAYPKWVFYDLTTGRMLYGEQYVPENNNSDAQWRWYLFDAYTGATLHGWQYIANSSKWVYYDDACSYMLYGQHYLHSSATDTNYHWYYFDTTTGAALKGFQWISSEHKGVLYDYTFSWMLYGWQYDAATGYTYHFNECTGAVDGIAGGNWSISNYVSWMLGMAADDSHGYDQAYRWGERGDYDCSSFVVTALKVAGFDTGSASYTGNMRGELTARGFLWLTDFNQLQVGDILLNEAQHTAVYIGNGLLVHASGNEWGGAVGGTPGDQTGGEMCVRSYYNAGWNGYLRRI